jgi:hypothetical protein
MIKQVAVVTLTTLYLTLSTSTALASTEQSEIKALKAELKAQRELLAKQQQQLDAQAAQLKKQSQDMSKQEQNLNQVLSHFDPKDYYSAMSEMELDSYRGAGRKDLRGTMGTPTEVGSERKEAAEENEQPPEIAAYIEEGGILLPKGKMVVTPELEYLNSSAVRVAIEGFSIIPALNIGLFDVSELNRDTMTSAVSARLGLGSNFEIEAKVPYVYRQDSTRNRPIGAGSSSEILRSVEGDGLGDIELGAHYQLTDGKDDWPYLIGNLRFKTTTGTSPFDVATDPATGLQTELPTGSGFYALQPSVTAIYPTDPGVFYGNLGYLWNFEDDVGRNVGNVDPGDSVSASLGMSLALNDRSSLSLGYSHSTVFKTELNGSILPNTRNLQVGTMDLGFGHRLNDWTSLNFNVSAGVTEDAPDVNVIFRVPMSLNLF